MTDSYLQLHLRDQMLAKLITWFTWKINYLTDKALM